MNLNLNLTSQKRPDSFIKVIQTYKEESEQPSTASQPQDDPMNFSFAKPKEITPFQIDETEYHQKRQKSIQQKYTQHVDKTFSVNKYNKKSPSTQIQMAGPQIIPSFNPHNNFHQQQKMYIPQRQFYYGRPQLFNQTQYRQPKFQIITRSFEKQF